MIKYVNKAQSPLRRIEENSTQWTIVQISRIENKADSIAKSAAENGPMFQHLLLKEEIAKPSTEENEVLTTSKIAEWIKPIANTLKQESSLTKGTRQKKFE